MNVSQNKRYNWMIVQLDEQTNKVDGKLNNHCEKTQWNFYWKNNFNLRDRNNLKNWQGSTQTEIYFQ